MTLSLTIYDNIFICTDQWTRYDFNNLLEKADSKEKAETYHGFTFLHTNNFIMVLIITIIEDINIFRKAFLNSFISKGKAGALEQA